MGCGLLLSSLPGAGASCWPYVTAQHRPVMRGVFRILSINLMQGNIYMKLGLYLNISSLIHCSRNNAALSSVGKVDAATSNCRLIRHRWTSLAGGGWWVV